MTLQVSYLSMTRNLLLVSSIALTTCLVGCGGGPVKPATPALFKISGKVTLDGEPLKSGSIIFAPVSGAAQTSCAIIDGEYSGSGDKGGHSGGKYHIQLFGFDGSKDNPNSKGGFPLWKGAHTVEKDLDKADMEGVNFDITRDEVGEKPEIPADPWENT